MKIQLIRAPKLSKPLWPYVKKSLLNHQPTVTYHSCETIMPRSKDIQEQMRKKVIEVYNSGKGYKAISKALGLKRSTVRGIIHRWRTMGTVENRPRTGRPTKMTPRVRRRLIQEVSKEPRSTSTDLQASLVSVKLTLDQRVSTVMESKELEAEVPPEPENEAVGEVVEDNKETNPSTATLDQVPEISNTEAGSPLVSQASDPDPVNNPSCDWLEPLEEDLDDVDSQSLDQDIESVAGSEWSGSVVSGLKNIPGRSGGVKPRRRRQQQDNIENWEDWPVLGEGWKRKEVFRRSGKCEGRSDTYYTSPLGHKVRSKVELIKYLHEHMDLTNFDFKSGKFLDEVPRKKNTKRRLESPMAFDVGGSLSADVPNEIKTEGGVTGRRASSMSLSQNDAKPIVTPHKTSYTRSSSTDPPHAKASANLTVNGGKGNLQSTVSICDKCSETCKLAEGQTTCSACLDQSALRRRKPYKKWVPCGQCKTCQITVNCGRCVSCRNSRLRHRLNSRSRKVIRCSKRKCLNPIRKERAEKTFSDVSQPSEQNISDQLGTFSTDAHNRVSDNEDFENSNFQYSDSEDPSLYIVDNDGESGAYEMGGGKLRRRSCGICNGCVRRTDCGSCDFCKDKPKFGGSNKKRQKCRLRQCQREAMKHLLPSDGGTPGVFFPDGWSIPDGTQHPLQRHPGRPMREWKFEVLDNDDHLDNFIPKALSGSPLMTRDSSSAHNGTGPEMHTDRQDDRSPASSAGWDSQDGEGSPSITQIFCMAEAQPVCPRIDTNHELMHLLTALRGVTLPLLWYCILVEGPRLKLVQCSKSSLMSDTIIIIEASFLYHITVQDQPLLPSHKFYSSHPTRLATTEEIVALLRDLERHSVCPGLESQYSNNLSKCVLPNRAATCDYLISSEEERCDKCILSQNLP